MNTKTATQETIETFAEHAKQAQIPNASYFYGEFKEKTTDNAVISINHQSDLVFHNKKNGELVSPIGSYWYKIPNAKDRLFIRFDNHFVHIPLVGDIDETIYIDILTGEGFYYQFQHKKNSFGGWCSGECEQWNLGNLTKEEMAPLVPLYNKWYLDEYAKCFADDDWVERRNSDGYNDGYEFLGIHDEFNCVWQGKQNELPLGMVWLKGENTTNWNID